MTTQELTDKPKSGVADAGQPYVGSLAKVTPEHIAYLGIALLAAVLRFADLGLKPLNPGEALEALAVWDLWLPGGAAAVPGAVPFGDSHFASHERTRRGPKSNPTSSGSLLLRPSA